MSGARTSDQILTDRLALLGSGGAWNGENLRGLLAAYAGARAALEADVAALADEISPGTSQLLLADYQAVLGPGPVGQITAATTAAELRQILQARWTATGGARVVDIEGLGAAYGIAVTVTQPEPAICGAAVCGAAVTSQVTLRFYWICDLAADNPVLRAQISAAAPADTVVVFRVSGVWV